MLLPTSRVWARRSCQTVWQHPHPLAPGRRLMGVRGCRAGAGGTRRSAQARCQTASSTCCSWRSWARRACRSSCPRSWQRCAPAQFGAEFTLQRFLDLVLTLRASGALRAHGRRAPLALSVSRARPGAARGRQRGGLPRRAARGLPRRAGRARRRAARRRAAAQQRGLQGGHAGTGAGAPPARSPPSASVPAAPCLPGGAAGPWPAERCRQPHMA